MAQRESGQTRGWVWGIATLVVCALLFWAVRVAFRETITVNTATVGYQDILNSVPANGIVQPIDDFQAHAPTAGTVEKLFVDPSQKVRVGQELVRMDDSEARKGVVAAQAALQSSEAALKNLQNGGTHSELQTQNSDLDAAQLQERQNATSMESIQALQAKGAASANEVATAKQRLTEAQAHVATLQAHHTSPYGPTDLATAQAQVAQARSSLLAAQSALASVDIHSPIAGTVYYIPISQYDFVAGGDTLLDVADLSRIQIQGYFDEPEVGKLAVNQPVSIAWEAKPNHFWHGHISQTPTTIIKYGTRYVGECIITVDDANGDLLPNTNVTVKVTTQQRIHVLSVPREALHTDGPDNFVYKIVNGRLHRTPVQLGAGLNLISAEITGGLAEGDTVVLGATTEADLSDGLAVKAKAQR
ncbi:efflux RND transporter periplasmic adaptor subunit [Granulicella sp. S156]|uniref:efflux RND transporter periplasmic adaptor subunit n=1 Tax=Granulicella sp. S156 TaxID=1747224 RepID=UPI00131C2D82|nr:efflux RND transporter periplasmic adaptor subunit [Granulicella sp. S156]